MKNQKLAYTLAGFVILFWGTSATAFKIALQHLNFIQLLFWSSLFSSIILLLVLIVQGKLQQVIQTNRTQLKWSIILGFLNPFLYYFILFKAYDLLPAQVAQPLNFVWPIILVLLSIPILGQKLKVRNIIALIVSFIGVIFISSQGQIAIFAKSNPLGVFLALISSTIWALFWLYNVRDNERDEVVKLFLNFCFATIFTLSVGLFTKDFWVVSFNGVLASAYIGTFEMGITFVLWLKALNYADNTARLSNVIYLVPFVALIFINLVLGETVFWTTLAGLILIICGIVYQQIRPKGIS
ncbi:MAG: DMT family transporter [Bacteroidales bacterium]|nr:MAG: DMT family transporter [Bacteroidales bacterium]